MKSVKNKLLKDCLNFDEEFKLCDIDIKDIKELNKSKKNKSLKFKEDYFTFYNDVKCSSRKKQDW